MGNKVGQHVVCTAALQAWMASQSKTRDMCSLLVFKQLATTLKIYWILRLQAQSGSGRKPKEA